MELAAAPFHLPQLLRDIAAAFQERAAQKKLEFTFTPAPDLPDLVLGDSLKLRQVIDNLLGNAIKFTPAGALRFTIAVLGDERVQFSVTDTGVGLSAADQARLFQPFQQAADGRPPEPGTGLGLAISHRMIALLGGRLEVESQLGQGSRFFFTLTLPILAAAAAPARPFATAITGYRGRRRRLLVVDDVATNRHVLRDLLSPLGFEISEAANGSEALAAVAALPPDLAFLDLRMPDMDGLELARRLRHQEETGAAARPASSPPLKIIAMSASVLSFNRADAFAAGCADFLPKPFREEDLLARLGLALHLEWISDATASPPAAPAPPRAPDTTTLPATVLRELLATAQRGEIAALRQRLDELRGDPLADSLLGLARSYQMERIRELLEQQLATLPAPPA
jgi:CheY-like chemotaxis protein